MEREKQPKEYLSVGKIVNTHGLNGELKIIPMTSDISRFDYLVFTSIEIDGKIKEFKVAGARYHKEFVLLKLKGIDNMTDAEVLKGHELLVDRENARSLDEDEYFIYDLIGLEVYEDDKLLGKLTEVLETGSNDVYVVKPDDGKEILIPALKSVILNVDSENKRMEVWLPEGLMDDI